jgi:6-phosphogluconate dehydrogenase
MFSFACTLNVDIAVKVDVTVARAAEESKTGPGPLKIVGFRDTKQFVLSLKRPRQVTTQNYVGLSFFMYRFVTLWMLMQVIILVQAGAPVDETIAKLAEDMEPGDVIMDGGNEWFPNSVR